jgi:hypothetical protein
MDHLAERFRQVRLRINGVKYVGLQSVESGEIALEVDRGQFPPTGPGVADPRTQEVRKAACSPCEARRKGERGDYCRAHGCESCHGALIEVKARQLVGRCPLGKWPVGATMGKDELRRGEDVALPNLEDLGGSGGGKDRDALRERLRARRGGGVGDRGPSSPPGLPGDP